MHALPRGALRDEVDEPLRKQHHTVALALSRALLDEVRDVLHLGAPGRWEEQPGRGVGGVTALQGRAFPLVRKRLPKTARHLLDAKLHSIMVCLQTV